MRRIQALEQNRNQKEEATRKGVSLLLSVMRDQFRYMLKIGKIESWSGFELFQPYFLLTISREREEARDF